jgi:arsenate reductase
LPELTHSFYNTHCILPEYVRAASSDYKIAAVSRNSLLMLPMCLVGDAANSDELAGVALNRSIVSYVQSRAAEFDRIPGERQAELAALTRYIQRQRSADQPIRLVFICTHNSRRSHMSQLWAAAAAEFYRFQNVETYSGGTEGTAFNPRAVAALERAGFEFEPNHGAPNNPQYLVRFASGLQPMVCFSKPYDAEPNPTSDFCAVMVCAQADEACPTVDGANERISIPYEDPKVADDTPEEQEQYDQRCAQIAREMLFVFSRAE